MPPHLNPDEPTEATHPSRRSILRGAGAAGAVGLAAVAGGGLLATKASAATNAPAAKPAEAKPAVATETEAHNEEPLVVYLKDKATGEFEIFNGTKQVTVRNKRLVNELFAGLATAQ
jgi:hypothetical protein